VVKVHFPETDTLTTENVCSQNNRHEPNSNGDCLTATGIDECDSSDELNSSAFASVLSIPVAPCYSPALTASDTAVSPADEIFDRLFISSHCQL